jgi:hypothetical protein
VDVPEQYNYTVSPAVQTVDYTLIQTFIDAATDQVETLAAQATTNQRVLLTMDSFPDQADPRVMLDYQLSCAYDWTPWWWYGFTPKDSIELVRRPVHDGSEESPADPPIVTYIDDSGVQQTFSSSNYTVFADKITLNVGSQWPVLTSRRRDCVRVSYTAGYGTTGAVVPSRLQLAIQFLAGHFVDNRAIVSVESTSEIYMTLMSLLQPYKSMRVPR